MSDSVEIVTVNGTSVDEYGFFCYKSKRKSEGYRKKLHWLRERFAEGLKIHIVYEGDRSVGFVETIPGEHTWRVVEAPNYLVVHCLWVVGRGKKKGYGSRLLDACVEDAQQQGKFGVAMVSSRGHEPRIGTLNTKTTSPNMTRKFRYERNSTGSALPMINSVLRSGVTINCSNVPNSRSRAMPSDANISATPASIKPSSEGTS